MSDKGKKQSAVFSRQSTRGESVSGQQWAKDYVKQ